ncbi:helix-turn-helix transcriptional regulator [Enterovirga sp. CN4-39]|uniref:helix-turn-helix transcriptional regulator n=1 Tax=Enterovirga sp. CN4-39 TaxID=3400910 RepID=UPI003BFDA561
MSITLLRISDVIERTKLGRSTVYKWMEKRNFPRSIELAPGIVRWDEQEIEARIDARRKRVEGVSGDPHQAP